MIWPFTRTLALFKRWFSHILLCFFAIWIKFQWVEAVSAKLIDILTKFRAVFQTALCALSKSNALIIMVQMIYWQTTESNLSTYAIWDAAQLFAALRITSFLALLSILRGTRWFYYYYYYYYISLLLQVQYVNINKNHALLKNKIIIIFNLNKKYKNIKNEKRHN